MLLSLVLAGNSTQFQKLHALTQVTRSYAVLTCTIKQAHIKEQWKNFQTQPF